MPCVLCGPCGNLTEGGWHNPCKLNISLSLWEELRVIFLHCMMDDVTDRRDGVVPSQQRGEKQKNNMIVIWWAQGVVIWTRVGSSETYQTEGEKLPQCWGLWLWWVPNSPWPMGQRWSCLKDGTESIRRAVKLNAAGVTNSLEHPVQSVRYYGGLWSLEPAARWRYMWSNIWLEEDRISLLPAIIRSTIHLFILVICNPSALPRSRDSPTLLVATYETTY